MTFTDAIQVCFNKYADFSDCASRSEFWWWSLFTLIASLALPVVSYRLASAFTIATLLPTLAVGARRLHDTDRSGWWQLLGFVPLVGWIFLMIWYSEASRPNRYGAGHT